MIPWFPINPRSSLICLISLVVSLTASTGFADAAVTGEELRPIMESNLRSPRTNPVEVMQFFLQLYQKYGRTSILKQSEWRSFFSRADDAAEMRFAQLAYNSEEDPQNLVPKMIRALYQIRSEIPRHLYPDSKLNRAFDYFEVLSSKARNEVLIGLSKFSSLPPALLQELVSIRLKGTQTSLKRGILLKNKMIPRHEYSLTKRAYDAAVVLRFYKLRWIPQQNEQYVYQTITDLYQLSIKQLLDFDKLISFQFHTEMNGDEFAPEHKVVTLSKNPKTGETQATYLTELPYTPYPKMREIPSKYKMHL